MNFYKVRYLLNPTEILHKKTAGTDVLQELYKAVQKSYSDTRILCAQKKYNVLLLVFCTPEALDEQQLSKVSEKIQTDLELKSLSVTSESTTPEKMLVFDEFTAEERAYLESFADKSAVAPSARDAATMQPDVNPDKKEDVFAAVENLIGMEEVKQWAKDMKALTEKNVPSALLSRALMGMTYLLSVNPGNGCTTALNCIGKIIAQILGFKGCNLKEYFIEPDAEAKNYNLDKVIKDFSYPDGKGQNLSVFALHIDKMQNNMHFSAWAHLLDKAWEYRGNAIFVFVLPYLEPSARFEMHKSIEDVLPNTMLTVKPFSTGEYALCFAQYFEKLSISVTDEAYVQLQKKLAEEKSDGRFYGIHTLHKICDEILFGKIKKDALGKAQSFESIDGADFDAILQKPLTKDENELSGLEQLDTLISLQNVKNAIREILATIKMQRQLGGKNHNALHMMFSGAPGTGKTVVARILGRILREENILSVGGFYEVSRKDLVGLYIGHTAPKTSEICQAAYGSVLFIDEAYTLDGGDSKDFGKEAIGTLIAEMENKRDNLVVIFAGYEKELEKLFNLNPGLRDRIPYKLKFENYNRDELAQIFSFMLPKNIQCDAQFNDTAKDFFANLSDTVLQNPNFSNARFVRNLVERIYSKAALRIQMEQSTSNEICFTKTDFMLAVSDMDFNKLNAKKPEAKIGF